MAEIHHETVYFQGHVQGVGFRYSTLEIARGYEVTGFVQNMNDGRVVIEAEGAQEEVKAFVAAVEDRLQSFIRKTERSARTRSPQFTGFVIQ